MEDQDELRALALEPDGSRPGEDGFGLSGLDSADLILAGQGERQHGPPPYDPSWPHYCCAGRSASRAGTRAVPSHSWQHASYHLRRVQLHQLHQLQL